jgi:hypothetical protein
MMGMPSLGNDEAIEPMSCLKRTMAGRHADNSKGDGDSEKWDRGMRTR